LLGKKEKKKEDWERNGYKICREFYIRFFFDILFSFLFFLERARRRGKRTRLRKMKLEVRGFDKSKRLKCYSFGGSEE
jgi:hypothetical protein